MDPSGRKGDKFENEVCKALSVWLVSDSYADRPLKEMPFRRRSTSIQPIVGFWEGGGDILHKPGIVCPFAIEAKNQERWSFDKLVGGAETGVWQWWEQAKGQASGRHEPLLLFTRNFVSVFALLRWSAAQCLKPQPSAGPVLVIDCPSGERVVTCLLADLARVPRERVFRLTDELPFTTPEAASSPRTPSRAPSPKASASRTSRRLKSST